MVVPIYQKHGITSQRDQLVHIESGETTRQFVVLPPCLPVANEGLHTAPHSVWTVSGLTSQPLTDRIQTGVSTARPQRPIMTF